MPKILVVDDDPASLKSATTLLRKHGHDVIEASDAASALAIAVEQRPELVIAGILMPDMDGYEFARCLRSDPRLAQVRVMFYTAASDQPGANALAEACGDASVVAKSADPDAMIEGVTSLLSDGASSTPSTRLFFHEEHARVLTRKIFDQLKQLEDANLRLRNSEAQYRRLFETNPFPMWIVDDETNKFLAVNEAAIRHYGYSREEFASLSVTDISVSEASGMSLPQPPTLTEGFFPVPGIRSHRTKTGKLIQIELHTQTTSFAGRPARLGLLHDVTERNRAEEQLHLLTLRLRNAQEEERTRVARYLHDELGQMLTALRLTCGSIVAQLDRKEPELINRMKSCISLTDEMVVAVQRLSAELRPGVLDLGIGAAIDWHAREFQSRSGIACNVQLPEDEHSLDPSRATELYRIFQEALTNIARHAGATRVDVALVQRPSSLLLEVRDNGRGINTDEIENRNAIGLLGMRERANLMGGTISIEGSKGSGTVVRVAVPQFEQIA